MKAKLRAIGQMAVKVYNFFCRCQCAFSYEPTERVKKRFSSRGKSNESNDASDSTNNKIEGDQHVTFNNNVTHSHKTIKAASEEVD